MSQHVGAGLGSLGEPLLLTQSIELTAQFLGLTVLAAVLAAGAAAVTQWRYKRTVPREFAVLLGVSGVAVYLLFAGGGGVLIPEASTSGGIPLALFALTSFLAGALGSLLGLHVGTRFAADILAKKPTSGTEVAPGEPQATAEPRHQQPQTITLPEQIGDSVGYEPVSQSLKATLAGATFACPGLQPAERKQQLEKTIREEFTLAHVDVSMEGDGTITEVTVGSRTGGIGYALPAETTAVAIRADPAPTASAGDRVQVWEAEPLRRVLTGEIRGITGDIVTLAISAADTPRIDPRRAYRLVTLPATDRARQTFVERLTEADETCLMVTVSAGSPLHGLPVGALSVAVVTLERDDGETVSLPDARTRLTPGTELVAIGEPTALRKLQRASEPLDPSVVPAAEQPQEMDDDSTANLPTKPDSATVTAVEEVATAAEATDEENSLSPTEPVDQINAADTETAVVGKADSDRFAELKAQFESDEERVGETEPTGSDESTEGSESTFARLKSEFESGEADWATTPASTEEDTTTGETTTPLESTDSDEQAMDENDDLVSLDDAEISLEQDPVAETENDDDLSALSFDDEPFDDEATDGFVFGEDTEPTLFDEAQVTDEENEESEAGETSQGEESTDEEDDEDDDEDSSGGSTFAQLKEEFESGEADWADDISDEPGGDMRLDE